jgi:ABC-type glycerol-3-phosphate transport system substrate-binding protein
MLIPRVAETLMFYADLVAGPRKASGQTTGGEGPLIKDIVDGNLCAFLTADWRAYYFKRWAAAIPRTLRMRPLPIFDPGNPPTSTWGGTCISITKACKNPGDAWKLIEKLYFDEESLEARRKETGILPPIMSMWDNPSYQEPEPFYYGDQKAQALFVELGRQVPKRYQTPVSPMALNTLTFVLNRCVAYVDQHNGTDGLREECQKWLDLAAEDLNRRIAHWRFD